jgi:hypothetical protein
MRIEFLATAGLTLGVLAISLPAGAEVVQHTRNPAKQVTTVTDDDWQPDGFITGQRVPATWLQAPDVIVDGLDDEAAWSLAAEVEVPLAYGNVERAWLKALYTDDEVFIRVRWEDAREDREHHPWIWDDKQSGYVASSQIEDSVMLSFEAGCEWTPSVLGGYSYDFDAWHWMAARSDPLGQAVDLYGNVRTRDPGGDNFHPYVSRTTKKDWLLKFTENRDPNLYADWNELDRLYMFMPVRTDLWVSAVPDGGVNAPAFAEELPAPANAPDDASQVFPQYSPVKLTGGAAEVAAKGHWEDGYWTVEFRRVRYTPVEHIYDTVFNRMVQFSVQVFENAERLDQASESERLYLQFLRPEQNLAKN